MDWDEKGNPVAVSISTHHEDEHFTDKDRHKGEELLHLIQEEVEVSGVARENENKKIIAVQDYILRKA